MAICSKTVIPITFKGISDNLGPRLARTGSVLPYHPFGCKQKGNQENGFIMLLFGMK